MGLMQVMPATARQVAKALPRPLAQLKDLYRPDVNIPIGTRYLRMSRSDLFNSAVLATAGYNAGPHRVIEWLPKDHDAAADVWVETVPYRETRGYLQRVMEYSVIYEHRLGLESNFLRDQMGSIPRRAAPS
jgi:soluble lytic murein transglycosylase